MTKLTTPLTFFAVWLLISAAGAQVEERSFQEALRHYRWFHAHPELSRKEVETSRYLADRLEEIGLHTLREVGGHGVVGVLQGGGPGPVVLYRADMDALPIQEATGLTYESQNPGVMHACGHDLHMACALLTLETLAQQRQHWNGTVLFVGQPAEEVGSGAESVISDPKFQELLRQIGKPRLALALHDDGGIPAGQAALNAGFITANVDSFDITVYGKGGHGAMPSEAVDPVLIGSQIVTTLQSIVSRRLPAGTRAVVTVGYFHAGRKRNIIPDQAELKLTVRSYEEAIRQKLVEEIGQVARGVAASHGAPKTPRVYHHAKATTPAGYNDPEWVSRLRPVFETALGREGVRSSPPRMVGEDFSEYSKRLGIPSVMFVLGAGYQGEATFLHSSTFAPDAPKALETGGELMVKALLLALREAQ